MDQFEIETDNAVAGVRGTTFRVDAGTDHSARVRVYAGSVALAVHSSGSQRHQVTGPQQVAPATWEKIVGRQMQMSVAADGTPGQPTAFGPDEDAGDDWAAWNRALDEK